MIYLYIYFFLLQTNNNEIRIKGNVKSSEKLLNQEDLFLQNQLHLREITRQVKV